MKRIIFLVIVFLSIGSLETAWAQERIIKLKDGSVIRGVVVAKSGDVYKIKSPSVGFISVREADVSSIADPMLEEPNQEKAPAVAVVASAAPAGQVSEKAGITADPKITGDWKGYQDKITANPESMAAIQALAQDKEIMEIVSDPKLKEAIASGDMEYLKNNEKFLKFVNNPTVKKITEKALGPEQGAENVGQDQNQSGK
jgi:hypothetical protein